MFNINFLPMTGFKLRTSGIGSGRSTNWATTSALQYLVRHDVKHDQSSYSTLYGNWEIILVPSQMSTFKTQHIDRFISMLVFSYPVIFLPEMWKLMYAIYLNSFFSQASQEIPTKQMGIFSKENLAAAPWR